jgi:hypothetical protein
LAVLVPLTLWLSGTYAAGMSGEDLTPAMLRRGMAGLWTGMGFVAVLAAPAMAIGAIRSVGAAVCVLVALLLPILALAWLTSAIPTVALLRGAAALAAWTAIAVALARVSRRADPQALPIVDAVWQLAMLALLAVTWHTWSDWIGP